MRFISRLLTAGAVAGAAALALTTGVTTGGTAAPSVTPVADEAPGYAVEDFNYPGADKILAEKGFLLKRGDGHITLATCGEAGLIEVYSRKSSAPVCFRVTGNQGFLTLEMQAVYGIKGNDYDTDVTMTTGTEEKTFDVPKNSFTPVGEATDPQGRDHTLVEIVATR
ncbi:hypothetical protein [Streptomyces sp. TRM64462]|uniref:hypothetical protein n=1 Tax=Streptomyces sp. TRM64462 TaxID=2741726 RepID=UPI001586DED0|nr:hypothetical protein [Streptomyces sp. TRM64462]